jgi:hypothetical protein
VTTRVPKTPYRSRTKAKPEPPPRRAASAILSRHLHSPARAGRPQGPVPAPSVSRGFFVFEEMQSYLLFFLGTWWIALIALVAGAFGGRASKRYVADPLNMVIIFVQVWIVVGLAKLAFGYVGYLLQFSKNVQTIYPEFVMPLAAGAYVARQLLKLHAQKKSGRRIEHE